MVADSGAIGHVPSRRLVFRVTTNHDRRSTPMHPNPAPRILLTGVILELTLATAIIHLTLGGSLFLLNGVGYLMLGAAYLVAAVVPIPAVRRIGWLPRAGLAAYASVTIVAYLVTGPFFALGWVTKGIELAIVLLIAADLLADADADADGGRAPRRPQRSA
jgi:hypothetical protein